MPLCFAIPTIVLLQAWLPDDEPLDLAFEAYWSAPTLEEARAASDRILELAPDFDDAYARLRKGRIYDADAPRGKLLRTHVIDGVDHHYMLFIPESYDASRTWPVRWDLHGGMGQPEWKELDGSWSPGWAAIERYENDYITVVPAGWWGSMWWEASQVESFQAILGELKRTWNVHENRVFMFGSSDGAIGEWFYAFRDPDPWAMYIGYVGFPARLTNRAMRADGQMHLSNLEGQRFYLRNGVKDRIVNIDVMRKYLDVIREVDVDIDYAEHADHGHDLELTREEQLEPFAHFRDFRRDPLPERLSWSTERTDRYNRRLWLVIDELDPDTDLDRSNILPRIHGRNVPRTPPPSAKPWGRVELVREGNIVRATTTGVLSFRLLLSPEEFDLTSPVRVIVNGRMVHIALQEPDLATLLEWSARDDDRRMLFAAELEIDVQPLLGGK